MLEVNNLQVICGGKTIVDKVSFGVHEGVWLMIVGPNGAGKSTILSAKRLPNTGGRRLPGSAPNLFGFFGELSSDYSFLSKIF